MTTRSFFWPTKIAGFITTRRCSVQDVISNRSVSARVPSRTAAANRCHDPLNYYNNIMTLPETGAPLRLAALDSYQILDTPPEPAFEDIVLIARELCDTPIALVSLVAEDRQWFKARIGLEACETPLSQSVCAHAVVQRSTLIVPDLTQDPRTKDNTLVTAEPFIRFYAGALLTAASGEILGTLCVIDTEPRPAGLTATQTAGLEALARQVMVTMEMRRAVLGRESALEYERGIRLSMQSEALAGEALLEQMQSDEARSIAAQQAGQIGIFEIDLATDVLRFSGEFARIAGLEKGMREMPSKQFEGMVIDEDRAVMSSVEQRRNQNTNLFAEYRIRRASDGVVRWLSRRGDFIRDTNGQPLGFTGTVHDVTERKRADARQAALVKLADEIRDAEQIPQIVVSLSRIVGETLDVSRAGYAHIDLAADTFRVEEDWTAPGADSLRGIRSLADFSVTIDSIKHGEPLIVANVPSAAWLGQDLPGYRSLGVKSQIKVPLMAGNRLVGVVFVHNSESRTWTKDEIDFVHAVADRSYAAIAKIEAEQQ